MFSIKLVVKSKLKGDMFMYTDSFEKLFERDVVSLVFAKAETQWILRLTGRLGRVFTASITRNDCWQTKQENMYNVS